MSAFNVPFAFLPKTWAVPVFPLMATGNPANAPVPVPAVTASRSAPCKKFKVVWVAGNVPSCLALIFLITLPSVETTAFATLGRRIFPPFAIAAYICVNFSGVITVSPCPIEKLTASPARILSPSKQFSRANSIRNGVS